LLPGSTCLAGFFGASCECSAATCSNTNMVPACTSSGQCICDAQHQGDAYCGSCTANYYSSIAGSGACNKYCLSSTTCNSVGSCTSTGSCQCTHVPTISAFTSNLSLILYGMFHR
jgi:hypothetical protein